MSVARGDFHCGKAESAPLLLSASMSETLLENLTICSQRARVPRKRDVCLSVILDVLVVGEYRN